MCKIYVISEVLTSFSEDHAKSPVMWRRIYWHK